MIEGPRTLEFDALAHAVAWVRDHDGRIWHGDDGHVVWFHPSVPLSIDGLPRFEPAGEKSRLGTLFIPRSMPAALLDGQHRRAAIEQAVREDNAKKKESTGVGVGDETISLVLFIDNGLEKAQQKFADLNRFGVRPNGSLSLLYDHRDELANLAKTVVNEVPLFAKLTDGEKTSIADGSTTLFTLRAVHEATRALLRGSNYTQDESQKLAVSSWSEAAGAMRDRQAVAEGKIKASDLREKYIDAHAVALEAVGRGGSPCSMSDRRRAGRISPDSPCSTDRVRTRSVLGECW